jgi:hypothetical protein
MVPDSMPVYRWIDRNVYRRSTGRVPAMPHPTGFPGKYSFSADYHQQYLAKNPDGHCGIGGCGVAFRSAELQRAEKA